MTWAGRAVASVSDAQVIERSLRNPEWFAEVFDRHAPYVHRYAVRRLGRELADDIVAETFLIAFAQRHGYHLDRVDARPWLYGIATNLVNQHWRAEARRLRANRVVVDESLPSPADRVAAGVTAHLVRGRLVSALADLPAGERDVLLLLAWEDLTYEELAVALGIPIGTVRSRLNRARTKLRKALGGTNPMRSIEESAL